MSETGNDAAGEAAAQQSDSQGAAALRPGPEGDAAEHTQADGDVGERDDVQRTEQEQDRSPASDAAGELAAGPSTRKQAAPTAQRPEIPDLTADAALDSALEALLLVVDAPAEEESLAGTLEEPVERVRSALQRLSAAYSEAERGIDLRHSGGGWRFYTRDSYAPFVERFLLDGQRAKLTRAALETLAVIAYRQPVTRARVAAVRGVNVDGVIRTLLARGLIEEAGADPETAGTLYRTTELFLERLGLSSLDELPPIAPLLPEVDAIDDV